MAVSLCTAVTRFDSGSCSSLAEVTLNTCETSVFKFDATKLRWLPPVVTLNLREADIGRAA